jgi:hypothetical protein
MKTKTVLAFAPPEEPSALDTIIGIVMLICLLAAFVYILLGWW